MKLPSNTCSSTLFPLGTHLSRVPWPMVPRSVAAVTLCSSLPVSYVGGPQGPGCGLHPVTVGNWGVSTPASLILQRDSSEECSVPSPEAPQLLKGVSVAQSFSWSSPLPVLASFPALLAFSDSLSGLLGITSQTSLCSHAFQGSDSGETQSRTSFLGCWDIRPGNQSLVRDTENMKSHPTGFLFF